MPTPIAQHNDAFIHGESSGYAPMPKGALRFDKAKSQYATMGHERVYEGLGEFTLNVWIQPLSAHAGSGDYPAYIEKQYATWSRSIGLFQNATTGKFHAGIDAGGWVAVDSTTVPVLGKWYMVTMRYDGASFKLYINGVEEASFARTGVVDMDASLWRIAYRAVTGQYMSMSISKMKFWNYALDPSYIQETLWQTPSVCFPRLHAFIPVSEPNPLNAQPVNAYVASEVGASNPFTLRISLGAVIPSDGMYASRTCYLHGGTDQSQTFDMKVDVQERSEVTFDSIIYVRGGISSYNKRRLGNVVYPITRESSLPLTIYTSDVPGNISSKQVAHIHRSMNTNSFMPAYICVGAPHSVHRSLFISGGYTSIHASKLMYLRTGEQSTTSCFIQGAFTPAAGSIRSSYVVADPIPSTTSSRSAHINGGSGNSVSLKRAFIAGPSWATSAKTMHIVAPNITKIREGRHMYMFGSAGQIAFRPCFIDGVFASELTLNSYICAVRHTSDNVSAYIAAGIPLRKFLRTFMYGNQPIVSSQNCYLKAERQLYDNQASYVHGNSSRRSGRMMFVSGNLGFVTPIKHSFVNGLQGMTGSTLSFINNNGLHSSAASYISGETIIEKSVPAFISGPVPSSVSVSAFVEGHPYINPVEGEKPSFVSGPHIGESMKWAFITNNPVVYGFIVNNPWDTKRCFILSSSSRRKNLGLFVEGV